MPDRPPFNMMRACFWLLAVIILVMTGEAALAGLGCMYLVLFGGQALGACISAGVTQQVREVIELALTTVLALLLAARNGRGPPDKPPEDGQ
jgi:hypothetical protein